ncbi:MAG: hypothetical protein IT379_29920, partial [Deltaproteobacteria bacterium]|nr:hypothetical protein [Deltaproteobacteria bacterium]
DPVRLKDDPGVPELLRADLDRVVSQPALAFDVEAGLARFRASVGEGGAGEGGSGGGPARLPPAGARGAGTLAGIGGGVSAVVALVAVVWVMTRDAGPSAPTSHDRAPRAPSAAESAGPAARPSTAPSAAESARPSAAPSVVQPAAQSPPTPPSEPRSRSSVASTTPARSPTTRDADDDTVRREVAHMLSTRRALQRDPARALALAEAGQREFRRGQFVEEREAIAVLALARGGRTAEAERRGARFLRRYPHSAFAGRVRALVRAP